MTENKTPLVECPTCRARGSEPCIRGRWPSPVWERGELMPHRHDSRVTAIARAAKK